MWRLLLVEEEKGDRLMPGDTLYGVVWGIERISEGRWINSAKAMIQCLGWSRRIRYQELFGELDGLAVYANKNGIDTSELLNQVRSVADQMEYVEPATSVYFEGLWRRTPKAWTLGMAIYNHAGRGDEFPDMPTLDEAEAARRNNAR